MEVDKPAESSKGRIRIEDKLKRYEKIEFLGEGQVRCFIARR